VDLALRLVLCYIILKDSMLHDREYMREPGRRTWMETLWPDAVTLLIIANVVVFLAQHFFSIGADTHRLGDGRLHPLGGLSINALIEARLWTVVTHMFVHQNPWHLVTDCAALFLVGKSVQSLLGARPFLYIYFVSGLVGAALQLGMNKVLGLPPNTEVIGASACVFGVFMALAVLLPQEEITSLIYFIVPVRLRLWNLAKLVLAITLVFGALQAFRLWNIGWDNFAHLGGALTGWYLVRFMGYGGPGFTYDKLWERPPPVEQTREYAGVKARRRVVDLDETEWTPTVMSPREFIEKEINPILEKISAHGLDSLTVEERKLLERARTEIMNRDKRS
jgi:membrane associated rhomboid family serine protease